jgi:hypothetical protein
MAANRSRAKDAAAGGRRAKVTALLSQIEEKVKGKQSATMSDYIRLIQLERELKEEEPPREIIVTWVDSTGTQDDEE